MNTRTAGLFVLAGLLATTNGLAQDASPPILYGYVKFDASWDGALVSAGNFARWVMSSEPVDPHAQFNMTVRQTRLGFRLDRAKGNATLTGRVEADFYGGGAENKNHLQARHAYVRVAWPSGWEVLAGQTSDVISPLVPSTLNYTVAWWAGNIGYRRPQLRVSKQSELGPFVVRLDVAATRTIGDDFALAEPGDTGSGSGHPTFEGHASLEVPLGSVEVNVGGHVHRGTESVPTELAVDPVSIATSSWGVDLSASVAELRLAGEFWDGANMDDQFGGIGQGLQQDENSVSAIASHGGWVEVAWRRGPHQVSVGGGVDDPADGDLLRGFRSRNSTVWATAVRGLGDGLRIGLEVSRWKTDYIGFLPGSSARIQTSMIYAF